MVDHDPLGVHEPWCRLAARDFQDFEGIQYGGIPKHPLVQHGDYIGTPWPESGVRTKVRAEQRESFPILPVIPLDAQPPPLSKVMPRPASLQFNHILIRPPRESRVVILGRDPLRSAGSAKFRQVITDEDAGVR